MHTTCYCCHNNHPIYNVCPFPSFCLRQHLCISTRQHSKDWFLSTITDSYISVFFKFLTVAMYEYLIKLDQENRRYLRKLEGTKKLVPQHFGQLQKVCIFWSFLNSQCSIIFLFVYNIFCRLLTTDYFRKLPSSYLLKLSRKFLLKLKVIIIICNYNIIINLNY